MKDDITFHDIRRTVKTYMFFAGVDMVFRDLILGNNLKTMDVHYLDPSDEALKAAMRKYTDWIEEQIDKAKINSEMLESRNSSAN